MSLLLCQTSVAAGWVLIAGAEDPQISSETAKPLSRLQDLTGSVRWPEIDWIDYETREPIHVWEVLIALGELEEA